MKYFMADTRLAGLERMMMDSSRRSMRYDGGMLKASCGKKPEPPAQRSEKTTLTINDNIMRIDTRRSTFFVREIENRRFMYQPQTGALILGRQYHNGCVYNSHAEEYADSVVSEPYDSFIRGWIGTSRQYPHSIIHFAPNIDSNFAKQIERGFSTLEMFAENGAVGDTVIRGFGDVWEQPLSNLLPEGREK